MKVPKRRRRIEWNELWKEDSAIRPTESNREFWNDFAPRFRKKLEMRDDPYISRFYEYSGLQQGESIFDMGCASGTLAIPYAKMGHEIYAADFSDEMLKYLMIGAREEGVEDKIHPVILDWNEDWSKRHDLPVCDVAISSRSLVAWNLTDAVTKLESVARDRICVGVWDKPANVYDRKVARYIGYDRPGYGCYAYIMNELMDRDRLPELRFIYSPYRLLEYDTRADAFEQQKDAFSGDLTQEQIIKLKEYIDDHLKYHEDGEKRYWQFDHGDESTIAHIMWKAPDHR